MKIGFDAKRYFHNSTGLGNYSRTLVEGLRAYAPDVEIELYDFKSLKRSFSMGRKAAEDRCDVFHGLSNELPLDIKSAELKSVVTVHDICWRRYHAMYHVPDILIHDVKCRLALKNADRIITVSESTKNDLVNVYGTDPSKITTVYQSVAGIWFEPVNKMEAREKVHTLYPQISFDFILSTGSINRRKNLLNVLRALSMIPDQDRPQLVVCGKGGNDYEKECRNFAGSHLRTSDVIWLSGVDTPTLKLLCGSAMAMVYPSNYEGFGLPIVEALLQKTPVITSNVSSMPEAAGPGGLMVNPSEVGEIADAICRLAQSEELRSRLSEMGYTYCRENFDIEAVVAKYLEAIKC